MCVLLLKGVLASPSTGFRPGPRMKANTIIHLQYLKLWEGAEKERVQYLLMMEEGKTTAPGCSKSGEES